MEFESVADAQRYLSSHVAECAYTALALLSDEPLSATQLKDLLEAMKQCVQTVTTTFLMLEERQQLSQKAEGALSRADALMEGLRRAEAETAATQELEEVLLSFFDPFELQPPFVAMLQVARAGRARSPR